MSSISPNLTQQLGLDPKTADAISDFAHRRRVLLVLRAVAGGLVVFFGVMLLIAICDYLWMLSDAVRYLLSAVGYAVTLGAMWWLGLRYLRSADPRLIARQLEATDPRLREDLLSAVELADPQSCNGSETFRRWLQHRVARRTGTLDIRRLLPIRLIRRWLATGSLVTLACFALLLIPSMQFGRRIARAMLPGVPIERASLVDINILRPSPPSGYVAEGDAVGVTVRVSGAPVSEVWMQWKTEDGIEGETSMSPRVAPQPSSPTGTLPHQDVYAANLSVGTVRLQYRILAGDAVTLWHELTPLPRPRVDSFKKHYQFPSYAKLADRVEETEHGDLKALVGTVAEVTVRFDEPVSHATIQFGNRGVPLNLDALPGSDRDFVVKIPIRTPSHYQVDATSTRSGLNNPFSPQYSVTPVIDTPPTVRWSNSLARTLIVSPLDVVSLSAVAVDDLPMDRVVQEFQVNGEPVVQRELAVPESLRELNLQWDWDLLHRVDGKQQSIKLAGGDIIRTRVVAIDRNSKRGESGFIELLIAEEGFDSHRHDHLEQLHGVMTDLADWAMNAQSLSEQMQRIAEQEQSDTFEVAKETGTELRSQRESLADRIRNLVATSPNLADAGVLELAGRALMDLDQQLGSWFSATDFVFSEDHASWQETRQRTLRDLGKQARGFSQEASRIEQYARAIFGEELTVAIIGDAMSLHRSLRPLTNEEEKFPIARFPRHLTVAMGRMNAIGDMIEAHQATLPESTRRHLEKWHRWSDTWTSRLQTSIEEPPLEPRHRDLVAQFETELASQIDHGMVDGRLPSTIVNLLREIRQQIGAVSDVVRAAAKQGALAEKAGGDAAKRGDSAEVARLNRDAEFASLQFNNAVRQMLERLEKEESLHRSRSNVDLQYAADMTLMHRAIENVTSEGYAAYRDEPAQSVFENLGDAFQIIEAKHEADMWLRELRAMMLAERKLEETAIAKIKHPSWIERYSTGLDWPARALQSTKVDRSQVEAIQRTRYNEDFNQARNRMTTRRWSGEEMLTAESQLDSLQHDLGTALEALVPSVVEARDVIRRYVLSLSEQAEEAAEKAREAQQRTESRSDSEAETAAELDQQQQEAEQATRETLESLADLANTAELTDPQQRELARDADAAAAQIQAALQRAEEAANEATEIEEQPQRENALDKTADALEDLSQALEQTAEHFQRAETGQQLAQSRQQLREAEQALKVQQELEERYDRAEAMSQAAQSTPEELMERLERELQENKPMQQELSEISQRAAEAAQRTLEKAAKDESSLNQSLERSDPSFQERKRRAARELDNLARRAATVDASLLDATERAIGWANTPESRPKLEEAREKLRQAVQQSNELGGENALLSRMQQTATGMNQSLQAASEALAEVNQQAQRSEDENIHNDESSRNRTKVQVERFARDARARQLRAANNEKNQWAGTERDAGRRISQAQRQKRDAEKRKRQVEDRIKKDENLAEALQPELDRWGRQIEDASRAEQAAKDTKEFAEKKETQAQQRTKDLQRKKVKPFEHANPAAELASRMTDEASQELAEIQKQLGDLAQESQFADQLRASQSQAEQFADQQQRIERDVNEAARKLRRAARHEQRLGQQELAQQLEAAADEVAENAAKATSDAAESLQQASQKSEQSPEANRRVAEATRQIDDAARQLAELLASQDPPQGSPSPADPQSPAEQRAEQLAQTLDELDRALAQSSQQQGQQGDASQQAQQPGPPGQGEPESAGDASPTLANAVDAQAQQAARQRSQQINPGQGQSQQSGPPADQTAANAGETAEPGGGERPGGGFVETMGVERLGSEWGQLRQRRTEDAAESRSATIAPQYRREIEAYFRAVAKRAAEREE